MFSSKINVSEDIFVLNEPRIITEVGIEAKISSVVEPVINNLQFRLVRVKLIGVKKKTLQIMAEQLDGAMTIDDCEMLSDALSPELDLVDLVTDNYHLEISSPGIDRPLVRRSDFEAWIGYEAALKMRVSVNGRKNYKGTIVVVTENSVKFCSNILRLEKSEEFIVNFDDIIDAQLILNEKLVNEALKRNQKLLSNDVDE